MKKIIILFTLLLCFFTGCYKQAHIVVENPQGYKLFEAKGFIDYHKTGDKLTVKVKDGIGYNLYLNDDCIVIVDYEN